MEKNRERRNAFKRNLIAVAVASCFAGDLAVANPTGPTVVAGQASFQQAGNLLSITNSPSTIINWRGFSIGASEITRFLQQSAASAVLNRVTGGDLSTILGALQSNGRVFLVNPTGIVIGSGARIDVAGFVASTLNLPDADFLVGRMRFIETPNAGSIVNQGAINAASGGSVYLVAPEITNSGIITTPQGEVILAAGKSVELVNPGTPNLRVEIAAPDNQAINLGQIVAESGRAGIYAGIISNRGVIRADTIATGENGEILLKATKNITLEPESVISASGAQGGSVTIQSGDTTLVSGAVEAKGLGSPLPQGEGQGEGGFGKGGTVQVLGNLVGLTDGARIDASGQTGGGTVLVGGDYQGKNSAVQNAWRTYVGPDTTIKADAVTSGDGGKVIVWSDDITRFYGAISARGGAQGGNGGLVETSSRNILLAGGSVDASAALGHAGTWLLDPWNTTISNNATAAMTGFDASGTGANIQAASIQSALNLGTSVTVTTGSTGGETGDITVFGTADSGGVVNINKTAGGPATLTLQAAGSIFMNTGSQIQSTTGGVLNVTLNADAGASGAGAIVMNSGSGITSNGGNIQLVGGIGGAGSAVGTASYSDGVRMSGATINAGGGDIALRGIGLAGTSNANGIYITGTSAIQTSGTGTITLSGTGGAGTNDNNGIRIGTSSSISSVDGAITLTGQGGASTNGLNMGVYVHNGATISATGTGSIALDGTGGSSGTLGGSNRGVRVSAASVTSNSGRIDITGNGAYDGDGVQLVGASTIQSASGVIDISGTSGIGPGSEYGVYITASDVGFGNTVIASGGNIIIHGTSIATAGSSNRGVRASTRSQISTSGTGTISITGQGGWDGDGVQVVNGALIQSSSGAITLTGTGGSGTTDNVGIKVDGVGTAVSAAGGAITLTGTGGTGTANLYGVLVENSGAVTNANGTITITGTGTGTSAGINLATSATINAGTGNVFLNADSMALAGAAGVTGGDVSLQPLTAGRQIDLGTNTAGKLGLTDADLDKITASGKLEIGNGSAGNIFVSAPIGPAGSTTLSLQSGGTITQDALAVITVPNLAAVASDVNLGTADNAVFNLAGVASAASGSFVFNTVNPLTVTSVAGVDGITAGTGLISLTTSSNLDVNRSITGGGDLTLAAGGDVRIIAPFANPVTVSAGGDIRVSGVNFYVGSVEAVQQTTVTAGRDLIVGNHPDLGGSLPELTGTMLVQGGTAGNGGNASATVHANRNVFIKAGSVEVRGGTATANASDNSFNTATANAELSASNNLKLKTTSGGLTVAGGSATARASYSGATNNSATANANATLAATNSMTLEVAGGVLVQGGNSAQAYASYLGPNVATANANASITAGTTLTLSATSLEVRGGDFARASASSGGPNTATANANATLSSGGDMILTVGTGGIMVRGGNNAFASASSGTTGLNTAQINANALVSSGGLLTVSVAGGGLTVRGGDNALASNSSGDGLTTALVNVKGSMLANSMDLTVTGPVLVRGGNSARASASCCQGSSAQNTATTTADALIRATNNLTLTVNGSNSLTVAGGDNARASGSEFSGQSRNMTVNTNAELSAGGNLTVIMNNQGSVTVRGGDSALAKTSASSSGRSMVSTVNARGKMAAGGLVEIKGPAGLVTVRGGDNTRANASGSSIAVTSATANVEGQITGGSVKITASDLTVRGGNNASASAFDNVGNTAIITANGLLNATSALDLVISGAMNVAGGNAARAMARSAGSGNTNQAATSAGALVTGGNITISAGSLAISGGVQGSSDRATFSGSGANRATTLANANIVATGNLTYTGGPVTLQGGTARTQGSSGTTNSATAEASAGIQIAGTKTLNITGDLQILGGQALDTVVAPNTGSATARAVLDPGALDATASGNVVLSDGTVTGAGSAYSAVIGGGVTLQADGMSIGGTINAGSGTVILRPNSTTRNINIEGGATGGVLSLNPSELQKITAGTLEIGRTTDTGTLSVNTALNTTDVNAATLKLQHQNISVNSDIGSAVTPFQHDLALLAGNGVSINKSIVLHSGGSLALVAGTGDLDIMPSTVPTRVESFDMALLAGGNVNVGSASGTQSTTVLANRLLAVGAASNFTVRGGAEAGAFTSVGGGGLTVIATVGDVIVAGGGGSNASATVSGTPDVDMVVGGVVRLDAGTGTGASAAISAGSATSIRLELPNLGSGGFFVNGQEGVVYDAATATGFFAGGVPAVLGQSLLVTYGAGSLPPSTLEQGVQQAINTTVQSTTEASRTGEDSGTLRGERTASRDAGPTEKEKEKEKEEKARPVCN